MMFKALLYKDYRLLRFYLRLSLLTSLFIYPVVFVLVYWFTETYLDGAKQELTSQIHITLLASSMYGLSFTALFAAITAGSTIALERSDHSSEFLACLPPTRWQNLVSKLVLLLTAVGVMLALHNTASWIAWKLIAYTRSSDLAVNFFANLSMTSSILCITGFSFAGSSLMKSNGGPTLLGLFSPLLSFGIVVGIGWLLDVPSEGNAFAIRYSVACAALGISMLLCGSFWYLNRSEP